MDSPAATADIIPVIMIRYLFVNANASPAIIPVCETRASCIPRTIAPGKSDFVFGIIKNYIIMYQC